MAFGPDNSRADLGTCSMHNEPLVWEEGGDDKPTVHGRLYCPKCSESLMRALDDVDAGRLHDLDDVIKDFGFTRAQLEESPEYGTEEYRQYAALFNDITRADVSQHILFSDRNELTRYLWAQGWRRDVRPEDVTEKES